MRKAPGPPLGTLVTAVIGNALSDLAHYPWRPHRRFNAPPESLRALHNRLRAFYEHSAYGKLEDLAELLQRYVSASIEESEREAPQSVRDAFAEVLAGLMVDNKLVFEFPALDAKLLGNEAYAVPLRRKLDELEPYLAHEERIREVFGQIACTIVIGITTEHLPDAAFGENEAHALSLRAPLINLSPDPKGFVRALLATFLHDAAFEDKPPASLTFAVTRDQLSINVLAASGLTPEQARKNPAKIVFPDASELAPLQLAESYLAHTPFLPFATLPVPFVIPLERRFEHCHILGGTGHGKTQLLQLLIRQDLDRAEKGEASVIVIDGQGDLIRTISHLALFDPQNLGGLADRLVLIDPNDIAFPAALNLFDVRRGRMDTYGPVEREKLLNATIETFEYFFGALLGAELTQKQGVIFRYLARLMLAIPDASIQTLRELMEDGSRFRPYMQALSGSARHFFEAEFFHPSFNATKQQILKRLWGVLSSPTFERMFSHPRYKIDLFEIMNRGSVVLISTAKDLLKQEGSSILGRFFIAQILQAATERAAIPQEERKPTLVYIDEAADYLDTNVEHLINQARKYNVGLTIAHQNLDQLSLATRATITTSTSVKFAGGVSAKDARALADDMHCAADFLQEMRKHRDRTEFACWIKNVTPQAVAISVPLGSVEALPQLAEEDVEVLVARSRERYCIPAADVDAQIEYGRPKEAEPPSAEQSAPEHAEEPEKADADPPIEREDVQSRLARAPAPHAHPTKRERTKTPIDPPPLGQGGREHTYLQQLIKQAAQQRGWHAVIEEPIDGDVGRMDVALSKGDLRIACEISVTTTIEHEMANVEKCLAAGYSRVYLITPSQKRLASLKKAAAQRFSGERSNRVGVFPPDEFIAQLDVLDAEAASTESTSRGYKVKVKLSPTSPQRGQERQDQVASVLAKSLTKMKAGQ